MKLFAFNRRVVSDQMIWVEAETVAEARRKLADHRIRYVEDHEVISQTERRVPARDGDYE